MDESNFIESGGTSIKAVLFVDSLEEKLVKSHATLLNTSNQLLDILLHDVFKNVVDLVEKINLKSNQEVGQTENEASLTKKPKQTDTNKNQGKLEETGKIEHNNVITWISKLNSFVPKMSSSQLKLRSNLNLKIGWKYDTLKCVDATPLLVVITENNQEKELVFIGSHSGQFVCIDSASGHLMWRFDTNGMFNFSAFHF